LGKVRPGVTEFRELGQHLPPDSAKAPQTSTDQTKPPQR
jgi:hypothetical protein